MVQSGIADDLILFIGHSDIFYDSLIFALHLTLFYIILGIVNRSGTMNDFIVFEVTLTYISLFSDFIQCFEHYLVGICHTLESGSV